MNVSIECKIRQGYYQPASETPFEWRFAGGQQLLTWINFVERRCYINNN